MVWAAGKWAQLFLPPPLLSRNLWLASALVAQAFTGLLNALGFSLVAQNQNTLGKGMRHSLDQTYYL